jgi:hypothetical protein
MTNQSVAENYLARARELEDYAQREEQQPSSIRMSPRWRDAAFLRHEALRWRAYAQVLAKKQPD